MDLNPAFRSTCRILFGTELGELEAYRPWLLEMVRKPIVMKSAISGQDIYLAQRHFSPKARFASMDELAGRPAPAALSINQIKDIDSLRAAIDEQFYCGNMVTGNSKDVEKSDSCTDCVEVLESAQCLQDKQAAYSFAVRKGESVFGCCWCGEISACIRTQGLFFSQRCFDSYLCMSCSDLSFCMNCRSATHALFSFNQVAKSYLIGNRPLPKDFYLKLKSKLLAEVADELKSRRRFPSVFEMVGEATSHV